MNSGKNSRSLRPVISRAAIFAMGTPVALENFLRMHTIVPGEGIIGRAWETRQAMHITDMSAAPELAPLRDTSLAITSAMVTPLLYAKQNMGVLAVANGAMSMPFSASDFVVSQAPQATGAPEAAPAESDTAAAAVG